MQGMGEDSTGKKSNRHAIVECKGHFSEVKVGTGTDELESHSEKHPSWVTSLNMGPVIASP